MTPKDKMELEEAKYEDTTKQEDLKERLKYIGLLMEPYVAVKPEDECGNRFDVLYEKSLSELRIYYRVFLK